MFMSLVFLFFVFIILSFSPRDCCLVVTQSLQFRRIIRNSYILFAMEEVDVTLVGGGPTGLFIALLLQPLGVSVRVLGRLYTILCIDR